MKKMVVIKLTALFLSLFLLVGVMIILLDNQGCNIIPYHFKNSNPPSAQQHYTTNYDEVTKVITYGYNNEGQYTDSLDQPLNESPDEPYNIGEAFLKNKGISNIYIDWVNGNIDIVETDDNAIGISETEYHNDQNKKLRYNVVGNNLNIKYCIKGLNIQSDDKGKKLTLSIPKNLSDKLKINLNALNSDIFIGKLSADELQLNVECGNIVLNSCKINKFFSEVVKGSIYINSHIPNVTAHLSEGDIDCSFDKPTENVDLTANNGNIFIRLPKNVSGFLVKYPTEEKTLPFCKLITNFSYIDKSKGIVSYGDESIYLNVNNALELSILKQ